MLYRVRHFARREFACKCGCGKADISSALVMWLDILRATVERPLVVSSGCRCDKHNAAVGGAPLSRHTIGCAADILTPEGMRYEAWVALVRRVVSVYDVEIVDYARKTHIHLGLPRDAAKKLWTTEGVITL